MAYPYWITTTRDLGIIPESEFFQLQLEARDPDELTNNTGLRYELLAGSLPSGIVLTTHGIIGGTISLQGIPLEVNENVTSEFVVRVTDNEGLVSDKTFIVTVEGPDDPKWFTDAGIIFETLDNEEINYKLIADDADNDVLTYTHRYGDLPQGLTIDANGNITGRVDRQTESKDFEFQVSVTDNNVIVYRTFIIRVHAVSNFTVDTTIDTFGKAISVDSDNGYWSCDKYYIHKPFMIKPNVQNPIRHNNNYIGRFSAATTRPAVQVEFELLGALANNLVFVGNYESNAADQIASCIIHGNILDSSVAIRDYKFQIRPYHIYTTPVGEYTEQRMIIIYGDYQSYILPVRGTLNTEIVWSNS